MVDLEQHATPWTATRTATKEGAGAEYSSVQVKDIVDGLGFWWVSRALCKMAA
jgi:hypothetical protein